MVVRPCHAKINLALAVGPPIPPGRADAGFHPVCSWMCCIGLSDTLRVEHAARTRYDRRFADGSPIDWPEGDDLTVRAHRALEAHVGRTLPVELGLVKTVPHGGGLGGGSSDAAGVLLALRELFGLDVSLGELRRIGAALGSDVPFFVDDGPIPAPALVSGVGASVERLDRMDARVVLILPPFGCPTGSVFRAFDENAGTVGFERASSRVREAARSRDLTLLSNGLCGAAERVRPELAELRGRVEAATGEAVHLSGSGSTLFLIGGNPDTSEVEQIAPECRVVSTRTL